MSELIRGYNHDREIQKCSAEYYRELERTYLDQLMGIISDLEYTGQASKTDIMPYGLDSYWLYLDASFSKREMEKEIKQNNFIIGGLDESCKIGQIHTYEKHYDVLLGKGEKPLRHGEPVIVWSSSVSVLDSNKTEIELLPAEFVSIRSLTKGMHPNSFIVISPGVNS